MRAANISDIRLMQEEPIHSISREGCLQTEDKICCRHESVDDQKSVIHMQGNSGRCLSCGLETRWSNHYSIGEKKANNIKLRSTPMIVLLNNRSTAVLNILMCNQTSAFICKAI